MQPSSIRWSTIPWMIFLFPYEETLVVQHLLITPLSRTLHPPTLITDKNLRNTEPAAALAAAAVVVAVAAVLVVGEVASLEAGCYCFRSFSINVKIPSRKVRKVAQDAMFQP